MTSPVLMPAGHEIVAADLDAYENLTGVWSAYTPTWTGTGSNPSVGDGTLNGRYFQAGDLVVFRIVLVAGSTTTFGSGTWDFALPVDATGTPANTFAVAAFANDSSAALRYPGAGWIGGLSSGTVRPILSSGAAGVSATVPFTWATSDRLGITGVYQA